MYNAGSKPGVFRDVQPIKWLTVNKSKFSATCLELNFEKTYKIECVGDIQLK